MRKRSFVLLLAAAELLCAMSMPTPAQEPADADRPSQRLLDSQRFHYEAVQNPGLLIPLYIYPSDIHTNAVYNRVMDLRRKYSKVPFWVILNPASGPGSEVNSNYTKAIDRLTGAGCQVLGYIPTGYGETSVQTVTDQLQTWRKLYPRVHGVFFDEMIYEDTLAGVKHQKKLNSIARGMGYWPTVGNPGADTPGRYFEAKCADVIVIHESNDWPTKAKLHGDYFGGHADYPAFTRAVMVHSQPKLNVAALRTTAKYARWVFVTDDTYQPNDPAHPNPWDQISSHLEAMCQALSSD